MIAGIFVMLHEEYAILDGAGVIMMELLGDEVAVMLELLKPVVVVEVLEMLDADCDDIGQAETRASWLSFPRNSSLVSISSLWLEKAGQLSAKKGPKTPSTGWGFP